MWWQLAFFYALGFGGVMLGCIARGAAHGFWPALRGILVAQVYAFYSWLLWPVLIRATVRQLTDRRAWAKTEREPPRVSARLRVRREDVGPRVVADGVEPALRVQPCPQVAVCHENGLGVVDRGRR